MPAGRDVAHIVDVDPGLADALEPDAARQARQQLTARVEVIEPGNRRGAWGPPDPAGHLGLMVVHGMILRRITIGRSSFPELLGPPDLIRPWNHDAGVTLPVAASIDWEVCVRTRLAVLDRAFVHRAAAWPEILAAIGALGVRRAQSLAAHQALTHFPRVEQRMVLLLWHLAERWGRVTVDGVVLELDLTHDLLARLAGVQRPSATTALGRLSDRGLVRRLPDRRWMLPHSAEDGVRALFDAGVAPA